MRIFDVGFFKKTERADFYCSLKCRFVRGVKSPVKTTLVDLHVKFNVQTRIALYRIYILKISVFHDDRKSNESSNIVPWRAS